MNEFSWRYPLPRQETRDIWLKERAIFNSKSINSLMVFACLGAICEKVFKQLTPNFAGDAFGAGGFTSSARKDHQPLRPYCGRSLFFSWGHSDPTLLFFSSFFFTSTLIITSSSSSVQFSSPLRVTITIPSHHKESALNVETNLMRYCDCGMASRLA